MSGTQKIVGRAIENVLREQGYRCIGTDGVWMTIGQVAEACEISKPTARKYVNLLVAAGLVIKRYQVNPMDTVYYRFITE